MVGKGAVILTRGRISPLSNLFFHYTTQPKFNRKIMERFFTHAGRNSRLDTPTRHFLETHGQILSFKAGDYFLLSGETKRYWCFILSGMAAAVDRDDRLGVYYRYVLLRQGYFTGTKHPFSQSPPGLFIQFLRPTTLFLLPLDSFRYAQENLQAFGNFVQVLKQRRMLMQERMMDLLGEEKKNRYGFLYTAMPEIYHALTDVERRRLIRLEKSFYHRSKTLFHRKN